MSPASGSHRKPNPDDLVDSADQAVWTSLPERPPSGARIRRPAALPVVDDVGETPPRRGLGPYELGEALGRGAFGTVYQAVDSRAPGRSVAIKVFDARFPTEEAGFRFRREVEIASRLDHPAISSIADFGVDDGVPYLVMRLIPGEDLKVKVERDGPFPPTIAARIMRRLVDAIQHAHGRGVVHRDLKPSNVLLDGNEPVLVDFGLSKRLMAADSFTGKGDVLGSPLFMAPEQLAGEPADERSDVFGLGGLLFFLLTGETPRSEEDFRRRATRSPRLPRSVPAGLAAICGKALEFKPDRRFSGARELGDALDAFLAGRRLRIGRRLPVPLLAAGAAALALAALALWALDPRASSEVLLAPNAVNERRLGDTVVVVKDGRVRPGPAGSVLLPNLKAIVDGAELWSPPRQELVPGRAYPIGRTPAAFITAVFDFEPGPGPIRAGLALDRHALARPAQQRELTVVLEAGEDDLVRGALAIDGVPIEIEGRVARVDEPGITWGHDRAEQLVVRVGGLAVWSPPRPGDLTERGVEYPVGLIGERAVAVRFEPSPGDGPIVVAVVTYALAPGGSR